VLAAFPTGIGEPPAPTFNFLLSQLAPENPVPQRLAAADVIAKAKLSPDQLKSLATVMRTAGPLEIDKLLTPFESASDESTGLALIDALDHAKSLTSLRPDSLTSRVKKYPAPVQAAAARIIARLNPDSQKQKTTLDQTLASLPPGDIRRGQSIFNSTKAACATCHAIGYLGGAVGPDLTRVGAIRQERDLLESILFPSASFVQSYEPVIVETENDTHSGVIRRNDSGEIVLATGAGAEHEVRIPRSEIKSQRPGQLSIMPAGLDQQLTRQELADLVAFLKACR
jgi:putative heme-binding domain-containing protein